MKRWQVLMASTCADGGLGAAPRVPRWEFLERKPDPQLPKQGRWIRGFWFRGLSFTNGGVEHSANGELRLHSLFSGSRHLFFVAFG